MGLHEDIEELKKIILESQLKEKKFKYPFGKKVGKSQKRKNYVTVLIINENSNCEWKKYQIQEQTILHELIPRLATAGHVLFDKKGNPLIILPNWSVEPFSPLEHYQKSLIDGSNSKGYQILMARMQSEKVNEKKKMAGWVKWAIGIIIVGGIIFALVSGGGGAA
jgi:hypothetical protein